MAASFGAASCGANDDGSGGIDTIKAECKAEEDKFGLSRKAELNVTRDNEVVDDGATITAAAASLKAGQTVDTIFVLRNIAGADAARPLLIKGISVQYTPPGGMESEKPAFECLLRVGSEEIPCSETAKLGSLIPSGMDTKCLLDNVLQTARTKVELIARYTQTTDNFARTLAMFVSTDGDDNWKSKPYRLTVTTKVGLAKIKVSPSVVEFDAVAYGEKATEAFKITNVGEAPLLVSALTVATNDGKSFSAKMLDKDYAGGIEHAIDPPVSIDPQKSETVQVTFTALDQNSHASKILIKSSDAEEQYTEVLLRANQKVPCISYIPAKLMNFGFVFLGTTAEKMLGIRNCGSEIAKISQLELLDNPEGIFSLDTAKTKGLTGEMPTADKPLSLQVNEEVGLKKGDGVLIKCAPESAKTYKARLKYTDNTLLPPAKKVIDLLCNGTNQACPTAVIHGDEEITPQMSFCLTGDKSFALPGKKVTKWEWKVVSKPKGAENHTFHPSNKAPNVCFGVKGGAGGTPTINVAGAYVFELRVWDDAGNESCAPGLHPLSVIPDEAIHVELLWETPSDTDKVCDGGDNNGKKCATHEDCPAGSCEHDKGLGSGTDMDLHFAHKDAMLTNTCVDPPKICGGKPCYCLPDLDGDGQTDPWFHKQFDCYWLNPNPNWGSAAATKDDNPGLDLDDTDGWGPENLNLKEAENGVEYWVGVHYWKDNNFGPSTANVRIYIWGNMELDATSTPMKQCDMWWVKRIAWPSGKLVDIGSPKGKYTPGYWSKVAAGLGAKCVKK